MPESKKELSGRVALVTGGSKGIGLEIAKAMVKQGAKVAVTGRSEGELPVAVEEVCGNNGDCIGIRIPDTGKQSVIALGFKYAERYLGKLDILVNNIGGVKQFAKFEDLSDEDWREVFEDNVMSAVRFSRVAFPLLRESKHGRVINIASAAGKRPGRFNPHYGAMKAAMIHLTKHLSNEWAKDGILVNAIAPHTVRGGVWDRDVANKARMDGTSAEEAERAMLSEVTAKSPLGKICLPQDVANLAVFLASDRAAFITGTCQMLDGGMVNSIF